MLWLNDCITAGSSRIHGGDNRGNEWLQERPADGEKLHNGYPSLIQVLLIPQIFVADDKNFEVSVYELKQVPILDACPAFMLD